jgi:hypothetical protein
VALPAPDPERRARLNAIKLHALVRDHLGHDVAAEPSGFARGAAIVDADVAWVLVDEQPDRGLGAALAWAQRAEVRTVHVLAETATGVLARRAEEFATEVVVWHVEGRSLLPSVPEPYGAPVAVAPEHEQLRPLIVEGGATPVVEHGVLSGEVRGLEVCRAVTDPHTGAHRLEVGVGTHDREAFALLHGDVPTPEALARVVGVVAEHRRPGADPHPLNRLGAERALRCDVLDAPERVGARSLLAAEPPVPRRNVKDPVPCVAVGETVGGKPLVVVCSTGIDLDLVPFAADARRRHAPGAQLVLVVPERDAAPVTAALAASLREPALLVRWPSAR